ncbi:MAG TPA: hypothetical protein VGH28_00435 [Polyangiaceae bacterium]|jgi:hypothetical protein
MSSQIEKLEALLARIRTNAQAPRHAHEIQIVEPETQKSAPTPPPERAPEVEVPLESRARLVTAPHAEVEEIEAEDVLELDDRHVVREDADSSETAEIQVPAGLVAKAAEPAEPPPPSSRRPIAEPAESPQEAEIQVAHPAHTPPPESGKQVAAEALTFDDDLTGVREAARVELPAPEASIQLQSVRMPAVKAPSQPDEMEVELPGTTEEATRPPPGPLPEMRAPRIESIPQPEPTQVSAEISRPTRPVAAAQVAEMIGTVQPSAPKTFGELLDLTLSL